MTYRNAALVSCVCVVLCGLAQVAAGATLCVTKHPSPGCPYSTIGAAVAAASPGDVINVDEGTYHEDVVIGKAISLVGENRHNTIIDATGLANGINVDGLDNGGLVGVSVSGFKVQNANFEGILVTNASDVTITDNHVLKNNINLNATEGVCTDVPNFETNEGFDCGEGVHLSGVDHSIVANNLVEKNSGGILLSDDTGATHDNLIIGNTVQNNAFDCGITLASHTLFTLIPGPPTAAGVFHNTITGNTSDRNGLKVPGAGAGVGLVEDLGDVVGRLLLDDEPADVGLRHPLAELRLDRGSHVVAQALHLTELVELRGGVRKGTAGHVVVSPVRCSTRGGASPPSVLCPAAWHSLPGPLQPGAGTRSFSPPRARR